LKQHIARDQSMTNVVVPLEGDTMRYDRLIRR